MIAALGPQNVFVFQQGAVHPRFRRAFPTIVTAGITDTILILLAVLGVSAVVLRFQWIRVILFGVGFLFLVYIGWALLYSPALAIDLDVEEHLGVREQAIFTASLSLLNPHAILDTIGVIGTNSLTYSGPARWMFAGACILVSWVWFTGLAGAGRLLRETSNVDKWMKYLNYVSALVIWVVALYMAWQFLRSLGLA
ncbi:LysE/ArgO family amino acid transporter [Halococcus sp. IIIV-5B]|uniref:LysE/ArgO family amino acid transporter n=1 Tax=Halococcus sp. IIIV-5B TaxID=2321230 RepID=UPI0018F33145|nr:LysE family transporter [Halococcus sp. IIIV-5B]